MPSYQSTATTSSRRQAPDVSYVADPYTGVSVYFTDPAASTGGWFVFGGTSIGTPQWAAILSRKSSTTSVYQQLLYASAPGAAVLRDITSGNNGLYSAAAGYDLVTGLGSPVLPAVAQISSPAPTPSPSPSPAPSPTPAPVPTSGLKQNQLYAAWLVTEVLKSSLRYDVWQGHPGGYAGLSDGTNFLSYQQARQKLSQGGVINAVFYGNVTTQAGLNANTNAKGVLDELSFTPEGGSVQTPRGTYPLYLINLQ